MDNNIGVNPFDQEKPRSPLITLAILGVGLAGCCIVFIGAFILFKPDQLSLVERYFPSPTATLTSTPTPTPTLTPTPTPNLTATQQVIRSTATAQAIQALATDSISQWPVLLSDPFDANKNNWILGINDGEYASVVREIKDGKYNWDVTAKKGFIAWVSADTKSVSDFHLSAEVKRTSGSDQSDYGLVFREDADGNIYYFGIDNTGYFVMLSYDSQWSDMIGYTKSSAILPDAANRLTVIAEDSHFIFFINDQFVGEMTDNHIKNGTTAIAVEIYDADLEATFEFDNFELRAP
jgi:hypothetical protein